MKRITITLKKHGYNSVIVNTTAQFCIEETGAWGDTLDSTQTVVPINNFRGNWHNRVFDAIEADFGKIENRQKVFTKSAIGFIYL